MTNELNPREVGSNDELGLLPEREGQADSMSLCGPGFDDDERGYWYSPRRVRELLAAERELRWKLREQYNELLYAVGNKYYGETRHQTALRYIRQAEAPRLDGPSCDGPNVELEGLAGSWRSQLLASPFRSFCWAPRFFRDLSSVS